MLEFRFFIGTDDFLLVVQGEQVNCDESPRV